MKQITLNLVKGVAWVFALMSHVSLPLMKPALATVVTTTTLSPNSSAQFAYLSHMPYANPNAPKGGILSLAALGTFDSINKWIDVGTPVVGTDNLFESLMTGSLSEAYVQYPLLADKVTYDPNDSSWVMYHINPKAYFWDGAPVTADDVKASMDALLTRGVMSMRSYLADVKETQVVDKQTVKFIFKSKDNQEIKLTVAQMPIWSKKSIDAYFDQVGLTPLMGSGAYKIGAIEAGRSITYVRDPNYWGAKPEAGVISNQGRNNFDQIKYVYYQNQEVAFEGFKSGEYFFREESKARTWVTGYHFPAAKAGMVVKETMTDKNPVPMQGIVLNLRRPIFQDFRVRQALTLAYDFEWLNKTMFYGQYERLQSFFYGSELAATGTPSPKEMQILSPLLPRLEPMQRQAVLTNWQAPKSDGNGFNRDNLLKAQALLKQAGFSYQHMRLYQPNGEPAKVELMVADEKLMRTILPYIRNLQRLGFDASVRQADIPQYLERKRKFDYDMIVDQFAQGLSPGAEQSYMWGSQAADEMGNQNTAGIKNGAIDHIIQQLTHASSRDAVIHYSKVLDRLLRSGYYIIPTYGKRTHNLAYWKFYEHGALPNNAVGLDYWWANKDKQAQVMQYLGR